MAKKQKRNFADVNGALMPEDGLLSSNSVNNTANISSTSVNNTEDKAERVNYSLYPQVIKAVEGYARDNFMSKSQVISQALINFIPKEYFKN